MVKMVQGLQLVSDNYYFTKRVPTKLRDKIGLTVVKRSLGTDSKRTATLWAAQLNNVLDVIFAEALRPASQYSGYTPEEMRTLIFKEFYKIVDAKQVKPILEGHLKDIPKRRYTLGHYTTKFLEEKERTVSTMTFQSLEVAFRYFFKPSMYFDEFNVEYVKNLFDNKKVSDNTMRLYVIKAKQFFKWLGSTKGLVLDASVAHELDLNNRTLTPKSKRDAFTLEQLKTIFSASYSEAFKKKPSYYFGFLFAYVLGLRISEVMNLKVRNIHETRIGDKDMWYLQVEQGKTASARRVIVLPDIVLDKGFREYYESRASASKEASLWVDLKCSRMAYGTAFRNYLKKIGIRDDDVNNPANASYTVHSLRHSFATKLISARVSEDYATRVFGHTGKKLMSDRYFIQQPELEDLFQQVTSKLNYGYELGGLRAFGADPATVKKRLEYLTKHWNTGNVVHDFFNPDFPKLMPSPEEREFLRRIYNTVNYYRKMSMEKIVDRLCMTSHSLAMLERQCGNVNKAGEFDARILCVVLALQNKGGFPDCLSILEELFHH